VRKEVSTIELLDMLDHSFVGTCQHRRTVARCKAAALQLLQHAIPGWLIINTDWAENGWYLSAHAAKPVLGSGLHQHSMCLWANISVASIGTIGIR
jgi:hypothetical protein